MTEEDATYYAKSLTAIQRDVILLCSPKKSWGYSLLSGKLGVTYDEVQQVGWFLQAANLATIQPVRNGQEYAGSAIFLNERGEQVRTAADKRLKRQKSAQD